MLVSFLQPEAQLAYGFDASESTTSTATGTTSTNTTSTTTAMTTTTLTTTTTTTTTQSCKGLDCISEAISSSSGSISDAASPGAFV